MTIIDNSALTLSDLQPDSLREQSSQKSQRCDFKSQSAETIEDFRGPSGGLDWVRSFSAYDPNTKPTLPLKEGMLVSSLSGSQHPGYDGISGANYEVPDGWKLTKKLGGTTYLVHMNTLETIQVPYTSTPDPNNSYPVPLLPPPGSNGREQTCSAYRAPILQTPRPAPELVNDLMTAPGKAIQDDKKEGDPRGFQEKTEEPKKQEVGTRPLARAPKVNFAQITNSWIAHLLDRYLDQQRQRPVPSPDMYAASIVASTSSGVQNTNPNCQVQAVW